MNFDDFQETSASTAHWRDGQDEQYKQMYLCLGLAGETGELIEKVKKMIRNDDGVLSDETRKLIKLEVGDVLWYLSQLSRELDISFQDAAQANIEKLADRRTRGVIRSAGDMR